MRWAGAASFVDLIRKIIFGAILVAGFQACGVTGYAAAATVAVHFIAPENYTEPAFHLGVGGARSPQNVMFEIDRTLQTLGDRHLPPGQTLSIDVLDIQLAGYTNWSLAYGRGLRIISDAGPPPAFRLRYTLTEGGKTLIASEETVTDLDFLENPAARLSGDPLIYEKILLTNWFRKRFSGPWAGM